MLIQVDGILRNIDDKFVFGELEKKTFVYSYITGINI